LVEQLRLAEKAAEDIYFAKVNRELIESLHKQMQAEKHAFESSSRTNAGTERFELTPCIVAISDMRPFIQIHR